MVIPVKTSTVVAEDVVAFMLVVVLIVGVSTKVIECATIHATACFDVVDGKEVFIELVVLDSLRFLLSEHLRLHHAIKYLVSLLKDHLQSLSRPELLSDHISTEAALSTFNSTLGFPLSSSFLSSNDVY